MAKTSDVPKSQEDYITQVSEEVEGRVTKKLSQEFSRTENQILGALVRLDDFLMNPLIQGHSRTTPETSRNVVSISQGANEDDSQMTPNSSPENCHDMVTGATEQIRNRHDMVTAVQKESRCVHDMLTGATEQIRNRHDKTGVHEEVTYCCRRTS